VTCRTHGAARHHNGLVVREPSANQGSVGGAGPFGLHRDRVGRTGPRFKRRLFGIRSHLPI
jgi:hypothetical protein